MSVPAELKTVTRKFLEQLLLCRPTDVIGFAVQYYSDERTRNSRMSHAVHSLLFLLRRPAEFRDGDELHARAEHHFVDRHGR